MGPKTRERPVCPQVSGVGAEIDAGVLVVGFEVGVDFDKVRDIFSPH
jgi:hypothetical protein